MEKVKNVIPLASKELEGVIISSMLTFPEALIVCLQELTPDEFSDKHFNYFFSIIKDMYSLLGRAITYPDVLAELIIKRYDLEPYLNIQDRYKPVRDCKNIIWKLKDIFATNKLLTINATINSKLDKGEDWYDVCVGIINDLQLLEDKYSKINISFKREIDNIVDSILNRTGRSYKSIKVSYPLLNQAGVFKSDNLIFLAASPKAGKTRFLSSLVLSFFENNENISVLWFSGEDPKEVIVRYLLSIHSGINDELLSGKAKRVIGSDELAIVNKSKQIISSFDLNIIDEPHPLDYVQVKFNTFCNKRKDRFNILIYDNFNIARDLVTGSNMNANDKDTYVASKFQHINTINNRNDKVSLTIVVDHLSKDNLRKQSLEEGYRPRLDQLKGSSRKYEVASQILFLNRPSLYKDLMAEEERKPNILINGQSFPRTAVLKNLLIVEVAANRHGSVDDDVVLFRYDADFSDMKITEYPNGAISAGAYEFYPERNITVVDDDIMKEVLREFGDNDFNNLKNIMSYYVHQHKYDRFNNRITVDYIMNKYASYIESLREYQNGAYTKKGKDIVNLETFISRNMYEMEFGIIEKGNELSRDKYLYGI